MVDTKIIDVKPISKSDLKIIAPLILNFNSVEVATSIMSYTGASFLKERLKQEFNLKFPQLLIRGGSGTGVLDLARKHKNGRVPKNGTIVPFDFTEAINKRWIRHK